MPMTPKFACIVMFTGVLFAGGCKTSREHASMAVYPNAAPVVTLGAGDALGRSVYVNDLIIAAREANQDVAITEAPVEGPIGLDD